MYIFAVKTFSHTKNQICNKSQISFLQNVAKYIEPYKNAAEGFYLSLSTLIFIKITSLVFAINSVSDGIHPVLMQVIARIW